MSDMQTVVGIDAAWSQTQPSGVAVVAGEPGAWRLVAAAPSYDSFVAITKGVKIDIRSRQEASGKPDIPRLLDAAASLSGGQVDLVTIDMPIATNPISGRRHADNAVSRHFGSRGCGTHSPSRNRPGELGSEMTAALARRGFPVGTATAATPHSGIAPLPDPSCEPGRLLEVYPHPALLVLLDAMFRIPYKAGKTTRYWPDTALSERKHRLRQQWREIIDALDSRIAGTSEWVPLPPEDEIDHVPFTQLKTLEDTMDAVICAWVGTEYLAGRAVAFGDETAAIWCPAEEPPQPEE